MFKPTVMILATFLTGGFLYAQSVLKAPDRSEGEGPFPQLIIRGATLINGTGAPPIGPVDIVIEKNSIKSIKISVVTGVINKSNYPGRRRRPFFC